MSTPARRLFTGPTLAMVALALVLGSNVPTVRAAADDDPSPAAEKSAQAEAAEFFALKRAPVGETAVPVERYEAARKRTLKMDVYSTASGTFKPRGGDLGAASPNIGTWTSLGPGNIGGRTRAIVIDPTGAGTTWYAAGVAGGVFKTTNSGASWAPVGDSTLTNLAVTSLALKPGTPTTILAGTGEGFTSPNGDAVRGAGIFKSTDGGATWARVLTTDTANFYYVNDLVWSPTGLIYAATSTGVWSWVDGATAPAQILVPALAGGCLDLALRPNMPGSDWLMASCGTGVQAKVYVAPAAEITSTTAQWDVVLTELDMGRTSLSFSPVTFNLVYALAANKTTGALHAVFRSVDGGYTWTKGASALSVNFQDRLLLEDPKLRLCDGVTVAQGAYANVIAADPVSANVVYVGGHDLFRSSDGGLTFLPISSGFEVGQPHYLPPSQHAIVFHPSSGNMIVGNDGGLFTKTSGGAGGAFGACPVGAVTSNAVFASLNNGLSITQFNSGAVFPNDAAYLGGAQGNGTVKGTDAGGPNAWTRLYGGGEGGGVAVDPTNPSVILAANARSAFRKSIDGGATFPANPNTSTGFWNDGIGDSGFLLVAPFVMDPNDSQRLWTGGSRLWRSNDQGDTWSQAGAPTATSISAIAVAPSDPNFALAGTQAGVIHRTAIGLTTVAGTVWPSVTPRAGYVSSLVFDPTNANVAYATYSTFGGIHVYKTLNAGATWADADGTAPTGIPDIPVHTIAIDPIDSQRLYAGTDLGVFVSLNGGTTWAVENTGFAKVVTEALVVNGANLYAFTHGRGAWRVALTGAPQTTTLDFDTVRTTVTEQATVLHLGVTLHTATHAPTAGAVTVAYATANGTATAGSDYTAATGTLTFGAGTAHGTTQFIDVPILQDTAGEFTESFTVGLSGATGGALLGRRTHTVTIENDGDQPGLTIGDVAVSESAVNVTFTVTLAPASLTPVTVNYATADGTAVAGTTGDYNSTTGTLTFPAGTTTRTLTVPLRADTLAEAPETFLVNLSSPSGAVIVDGQGVATINDNDIAGTIQFSAPAYTATEAGLKATITVTRTGGTATGVSVPYQTIAGTATATTDYTTTTGTLSFGATTSATFSVPVVNDTLDENDETVILQLLPPSGYGAVLGAQSTAVLTITDNDTAGTLSFSSATYSAVEGTSALVTVKRTGGAASAVTVHYATSDGSATQPADYTATSGTLTFAVNETQKTFSVPLAAENPILVEGDETLNLTLSAPTGGGVLAPPSVAVLTIQDASPKVTFTAAATSVAETATSLKLTVNRVGPTTTAVTVPYATSDGTAKTAAVGSNPADYTAAAGTLTFAAGVTSQTITLVLKPDTVVEGPESFTVTLGAPTGGLLGAISTETVNITDEDAGGILVFNAATFSVNEPLTAPGAAPAKATITVKRTSGIASGVTVHWTTSDGSAKVVDGDYGAASGTLTFAAGIASQTFTVNVPPDNVVEGYETFGVGLDTPTGGASLGPLSTATVTIVDSEPVVQFSAATYTVTEGTAKATVSLKRTGSLVGALTVSLATAGGTATYGAGGDYNNVPATVVMPASAAAKTFTFDILQDALVESTETAPLAVTGCTPGCTVGPQVGTVVSITDDEPVVTWSAATYTVGEATAKATFTLKRTGSLTAAVDVTLAVTGGNATGGGVDYNNLPLVVTIPAKAASKAFTVDIVNDTLGEPNETLQLQIVSVLGGYVGTLKDTVLTITDNEPSIAFAVAAYTANEPANTAVVPLQLTVTVRRTGVLTQVSSVDYAIVGNTATFGADYVPTAPTLATGTLSFPVNVAAVTFKISILHDLVDEPDETIGLTLSNAIGAKLGAITTSTVTIKDND